MKKSKTITILENMDNWQWLSNTDLNNIAGWRFSARIHDLKKYWVRFNKKQWEWCIEWFNIIYIPKNLQYKGRTSIRMIREKTLIQKFKSLFV